MNKRGATFASIIAIIGAVMIATGFAWLLAINWDTIPDFLKIIILVFITSSSYAIGVYLRQTGYRKIGQSLFILGALLYTLSVFLIAQIFNLNPGLQGTAMLTLIALIGVVITAYVFKSYVTLFIAFIEFGIWAALQIAALAEASDFISGATIIFYVLCIGVLFYSLSIIHRITQHKFARLYQFWTAFYFLVFTYILSFQMLLPVLWSTESVSFASPIIFTLLIFGAATTLLLIGTILYSLQTSHKISQKEILGVLITIIVLLLLITMTSFAKNTIGTCYEKRCYDYETENKCLNQERCDWMGEGDSTLSTANNPSTFQRDIAPRLCREKSCYNINAETECASEYSALGCVWGNQTFQEEFRCYELNCYDRQTRTTCNEAPEIMNCNWENDECKYTYNDENPVGCNKNRNKYKACTSDSTCNWRASSEFSGKDAPAKLWLIWIIINIGFLALILGVIGYGLLEKFPAIVNLGFIAFSLDILTRYIGFLMDLWGRTSLAIIFIIGGGVLIIAGYLIERWREKVIKGTK